MDKNLTAKIVRFHRKKSGLSQEKLAKLSGVGKTVVFDIEKGKLTVRMDTYLKVFKVLNVRMRFVSPLMEKFEEALDASD